jgi:hypothetical protein
MAHCRTKQFVVVWMWLIFMGATVMYMQVHSRIHAPKRGNVDPTFDTAVPNQSTSLLSAPTVFIFRCNTSKKCLYDLSFPVIMTRATNIYNITCITLCAYRRENIFLNFH